MILLGHFPLLSMSPIYSKSNSRIICWWVRYHCILRNGRTWHCWMFLGMTLQEQYPANSVLVGHTRRYCYTTIHSLVTFRSNYVTVLDLSSWIVTCHVPAVPLAFKNEKENDNYKHNILLLSISYWRLYPDILFSIRTKRVIHQSIADCIIGCFGCSCDIGTTIGTGIYGHHTPIMWRT